MYARPAVSHQRQGCQPRLLLAGGGASQTKASPSPEIPHTHTLLYDIPKMYGVRAPCSTCITHQPLTSCLQTCNVHGDGAVVPRASPPLLHPSPPGTSNKGKQRRRGARSERRRHPRPARAANSQRSCKTTPSPPATTHTKGSHQRAAIRERNTQWAEDEERATGRAVQRQQTTNEDFFFLL